MRWRGVQPRDAQTRVRAAGSREVRKGRRASRAHRPDRRQPYRGRRADRCLARAVAGALRQWRARRARPRPAVGRLYHPRRDRLDVDRLAGGSDLRQGVGERHRAARPVELFADLAPARRDDRTHHRRAGDGLRSFRAVRDGRPQCADADRATGRNRSADHARRAGPDSALHHAPHRGTASVGARHRGRPAGHHPVLGNLPGPGRRRGSASTPARRRPSMPARRAAAARPSRAASRSPISA